MTSRRARARYTKKARVKRSKIHQEFAERAQRREKSTGEQRPPKEEDRD